MRDYHVYMTGRIAPIRVSASSVADAIQEAASRMCCATSKFTHVERRFPAHIKNWNDFTTAGIATLQHLLQQRSTHT